MRVLLLSPPFQGRETMTTRINPRDPTWREVAELYNQEHPDDCISPTTARNLGKSAAEKILRRLTRDRAVKMLYRSLCLGKR